MRRLRRRQAGQVILEYVIMLVLLTVFSLSLLALVGAFSKQGSRMIELVSADFP
ncbi:MAG: hypothetical protein HPZ91_20305 [Lentisphaeria bacterium]|nr:hypothetical protein [Lentisphaeria bacterium]